MVFEQLHCRLAAALPGDALQQLGECLLVSAREQRLAVRAQPVCERWRADPALLTTVDDESLRLELLQMVADRVSGDTQLAGEVLCCQRLRALQQVQDLPAKSFVRRELRVMGRHGRRILREVLGIVN